MASLTMDVGVRVPRARIALCKVVGRLCGHHLVPLWFFNWTLRRLHVWIKVGRKWERHPIDIQYDRRT